MQHITLFYVMFRNINYTTAITILITIVMLFLEIYSRNPHK